MNAFLSQLELCLFYVVVDGSFDPAMSQYSELEALEAVQGRQGVFAFHSIKKFVILNNYWTSLSKIS